MPNRLLKSLLITLAFVVIAALPFCPAVPEPFVLLARFITGALAIMFFIAGVGLAFDRDAMLERNPKALADILSPFPQPYRAISVALFTTIMALMVMNGQEILAIFGIIGALLLHGSYRSIREEHAGGVAST